MLSKIHSLLLNEKFILAVIVTNSLIIFLQESGVNNRIISILDVTCTLVFLVEMIFKLQHYGFKKYWRDGWNMLDGTLVILSIPSIIAFFAPTGILFEQFAVLLALRLLRVLRFFRLLHCFPNFKVIMKAFGLAMRESFGVFIGLCIVIIIIALISCELFSEAAPVFFGTPMDSIYSIFRICTGEGWNEIPDTIAAGASLGSAVFVRTFFAFVLILCSIIGLSLLNSIFVDAMVNDNNDEVLAKIDSIEKKIDKILQEKGD